jgi:hemoglobin-like flavoprotein
MPYRELMEKRLRFLEIDDKTIEQIRQAKSILEPAMDEVLDNLYSHILDEPELQPLFADKSEIEKARAAQKQHWMDSLFIGKYDNAFYEKTSRIGRAHARIGLTPNWYIGGYNRMLCEFIGLIYKHYADNTDDAISLIQAISKIIYLDMDLVINCYLDAKDESIRRMLVSSTELRAEMWKFSDELNAVAAEINSTAEALSKDTQNNLESDASTPSQHSRSWDEVHENTKVLVSQAEQLKTRTKGLDEHLKHLPLSEKLYLPEAGPLSVLKDMFFGRKYHYHRSSE